MFFFSFCFAERWCFDICETGFAEPAIRVCAKQVKRILLFPEIAMRVSSETLTRIGSSLYPYSDPHWIRYRIKRIPTDPKHYLRQHMYCIKQHIPRVFIGYFLVLSFTDSVAVHILFK
jgi:hypothetical protein